MSLSETQRRRQARRGRVKLKPKSSAPLGQALADAVERQITRLGNSQAVNNIRQLQQKVRKLTDKVGLDKVEKLINEGIRLTDENTISGIAGQGSAELIQKAAKKAGIDPRLAGPAIMLVGGLRNSDDAFRRIKPRKAPSVPRSTRQQQRLGNSSDIATRKNVPPNAVDQNPHRNNLGDVPNPPTPDGWNPRTRRVEPRTLSSDLGAIDKRQVRAEARSKARDPVGTARAKASADASTEATTRELRAQQRRGQKPKQPRREVTGDRATPQPRTEYNPATGTRLTRPQNITPPRGRQAPEAKPSSLIESRRQRARQQNVRLERAKQRIRAEGATRNSNKPLTPAERANIRKFRQQQVLDPYHPDGPRFRQHNADDTWREYNEGQKPGTKADRLREGDDYKGDRFTDTGGFSPRYDRAGVEESSNPGFSIQSTDITGAGMGRRGATGAIRGTFDIEKVKKDLKKAGIDPKKDPEAAKEFFRENYPVQVYKDPVTGEIRQVMRPGSKPGAKPGTVKTSSTLNDQIEVAIRERRFPEQFNQLEAERSSGARMTRAERRDRARRRDGKPRFSDRYRVEGGQELPTPDRARKGQSSKTSTERKMEGNIPGGSRIPQSKVEQARRDRARARLRKSDVKDGSVDWKSGSSKRPGIALSGDVSATRRMQRELRFQRQQERARRRARVRNQFEVSKTRDTADGRYGVVWSPDRAAARFKSGRTRMEDRRTGRDKDKPQLNKQVPRRTEARRGGYEATLKETDPQQTGGKRGERVASERETRIIAESVNREKGARSRLIRRERAERRAGTPGDRRNTSQHRQGGKLQPVGGAKPGAGGTKPPRRRSVRAIPKDQRNAQLTPAQQQKMAELKAKDDQFNKFYPDGRLRNTYQTDYPTGGRKSDPKNDERQFVSAAKSGKSARKANRKLAERAASKPKANKDGSPNKADQKQIDKAKAEIQKRKREAERLRRQRLERRLRRIRR